MPDPAYRPRNLCNVIDRMLPLIPGDSDRIRGDLVWARDAMLYHPPERIRESARLVTDILIHHIPPAPPMPDWADAVLRIWRAEDTMPSDYEF